MDPSLEHPLERRREKREERREKERKRADFFFCCVSPSCPSLQLLSYRDHRHHRPLKHRCTEARLCTLASESVHQQQQQQSPAESIREREERRHDGERRRRRRHGSALGINYLRGFSFSLLSSLPHGACSVCMPVRAGVCVSACHDRRLCWQLLLPRDRARERDVVAIGRRWCASHFQPDSLTHPASHTACVCVSARDRLTQTHRQSLCGWVCREKKGRKEEREKNARESISLDSLFLSVPCFLPLFFD